MDLIHCSLDAYVIIQSWWRLLTPRREQANARNTHAMSLDGIDRILFVVIFAHFCSHKKKLNVASDILYMRDVGKEK